MDFSGFQSESYRSGYGHDSHHRVQLYESDSFLADAVASFLADGLKASQPVLVIATPSHRIDFGARLKSRGFDVDRLSTTGEVAFIDARETLATFMCGAMPDGDKFRQSIGSVIESRPRARDTILRAYGEMVDVLWRDGNPEAAIRLEELWNDLAGSYGFSLLCAYHMGNFYKESHGCDFERVCGAHTHVIPSESYTVAADSQTRLREISRLQQRAGALEAELRHRKELESALRDALAHRRSAEAECERLLAAEKKARADAERASRVKDDFLAVLSHELRTPLNAILGWTQIVTQGPAEQATTHHALEVIQRNAELQLHLINDLLDISRIVAGKMQLKKDAVDLAAVVNSAVDHVRPHAAAKNIEIDVEVHPTVQLTTGDRDRLQQVMWNLLSNAIKFTPDHGRVEVVLRQSDDEAQIRVKDSGQGIASDFLPHVFDRFTQENASPTRGHGGLGLGLAVVRHLVEAHGGRIEAESGGPGLGSTFTVTLPLPCLNEMSA